MTPLPLKYIGGHPALDLVNTVDWTARGPQAERLPDYATWIEWGEGNGLLGPGDARRLRSLARREPGTAAHALDAVRRARALLQGVLSHRARGKPADADDLAAVNGLLHRALARLELAATADGALLVWRGMGRELDSPLWPVIWAAAGLLTSEDADRIRVCDGPDCGWMYLDRSRNGFRRWCEMSTCGTREKNRRRAGAT
jgi:predicted RNA-binding Zn ribbon-like protein